MFWRELHRCQPAGWGRAIWRLYGVVSVIFTFLAIVAARDIASGYMRVHGLDRPV